MNVHLMDLKSLKKQIQMGQLTIRSSVLDFSLSPIETSNTGELSSKVELKASLQPNEALKVRNTINLVGSFDFSIKTILKVLSAPSIKNSKLNYLKG